MRQFMFALIGAASAIFLSYGNPACAQAAPPYGYWGTQSGETLLITNNLCSLAVYGRITTSGACGWNPSYNGGILTIMSSQLYRPAPIYFNVVIVSPTQISVNGDLFTRLR